MGKAFESIRQGLKEAAAHARGEATGVKVYVRISAIADGHFSLIVDDETVSRRVRGGDAQAHGLNVAQPSTISLKRLCARGAEADGWGWVLFMFQTPAGPPEAAWEAVRDGDSHRRCCSLAVAHGPRALEFDLVAAVDDAVEDRVGQRGVVEVGVPGFYG
jgi:hypothetical protein